MISLQDLKAGTRLRLHSSAVVEVIDNPRDGLWLLAQPVLAADGSADNGEDIMVDVNDVAAVL